MLNITRMFTQCRVLDMNNSFMCMIMIGLHININTLLSEIFYYY